MRILLTGGSGCGKSTFAERLARELPAPRYYLATMRPFEAESRAKIMRHQAQRADAGFITIERETQIGGVDFPARGTVLLECMCNLLANEMFDEAGNEREVYDTIRTDILALEQKCDTLIVVTNEVGSDGGNYDASTARYIQTLGRLNCALAARFDAVAELVCGIPLVLKGQLPE